MSNYHCTIHTFTYVSLVNTNSDANNALETSNVTVLYNILVELNSIVDVVDTVF